MGILLVAVGAFSAIAIPVGKGLNSVSRSNPIGALATQAGTPAGLWIRLAAFLIDFAAHVGMVILLFILLNLYEAIMGPPSAFARAVLIIAYFTALVWIEVTSPGKRALGLQILRPNGSRVGLGRKFCRFLAYTLSVLTLYIGFLMIAFRKDKRGLHDLICDTVVVHR